MVYVKKKRGGATKWKEFFLGNNIESFTSELHILAITDLPFPMPNTAMGVL